MKLFTAIAVVLIVAINGNVIEYLVSYGYPTPLILVFAGALSFLINSAICIFKNQSILPKSWRLQGLRLINNGLSMFLILESYKYLSAGSVGLVQRTDIPFIIMLSFLYGEKRTSMQFWLSIWTVLMIIFLIIDARFINEEPLGFVFAFAGVMLLSLSYLLVKKSAFIESPYVIGNVNCLGYIAVGTALMFAKGSSWHIAFEHLWAFIILGILLTLIYIVAMPLYKWFTAERARFPFIIGALATIALEMIIENKWFMSSHIALVILISGMIATISLNANTPETLFNVLGKVKTKVTGKLTVSEAVKNESTISN